MNAKACKRLRRAVREYAGVKARIPPATEYSPSITKKLVRVEESPGVFKPVVVDRITLRVAPHEPRAVYRKAKAVLRRAA